MARLHRYLTTIKNTKNPKVAHDTDKVLKTMTQKERIAIAVLLDRVETEAKYIGCLKADAAACMKEKNPEINPDTMNYPFLYGYVSQGATDRADELKKAVETFKNKIGWKE